MTQPGAVRRLPVRQLKLRSFGAYVAAVALVASGCAPPGATAPPTTPPSTTGEVTAGVQIGAAPPAPAGWTAPARITPVDPGPGMFKSVGDAPPQPAAKVRVFFLGMQW